MRLLKQPTFGLIEILPCVLTAVDLCRIKTKIENEVKKEQAIYSVKKMRITNDSLEVTLTYDWSVLDDYGDTTKENYTYKVREITSDIESVLLNIQTKGIIVLKLITKRKDCYLNPPLSLCNLFSRLVVKPLWTLGVLEEIEQNVIPNYFYENIRGAVFRDLWPRLSYSSNKESFEQNILTCLEENLKKNLKAESSGRLIDILDFWVNITFLSIYCGRIQILLASENPHVQCLIENYKSRISQLQYLTMQRFVKQIVDEVRWSLI